MCHETVFWYACDHLVLNETKCPFVGVISDHGQGTTATSFATDVCSLCKQPPTMVIEALKANQLSCFDLAEICEVDVKEDHFPDAVAQFFAKKEHLEINQPDPKCMNAAATVASEPARGSPASSSTTTATTARASNKSSTSKAKPGPSPAPQPKRAPASQNKKNPPRSTPNTQKAKAPAAKKSMPPPPPPAPRQQTPQVQQQPATPKPMPPPPQRAPAVSSQSAVPQGNLAEDLAVYQALEQWQREVSSPGNNFTDVDFNALKSFIDLEKQSGYLPPMSQNAQMQQYNFNPQQPQYGAQMQYGNHPQDRAQPQRNVQAQANAPIRPCIQPLHQMTHIQNSFQAQQSKAQENTQTQQSIQSQKGVPYDGTNWGQEGVYLPRENYYVAGTKSPVVDPHQLSMPPLPAVDPTAPLPGFTTNQFDNTATFSPYANLENFLPNMQKPVAPMYPTNATPHAINHAQAKNSPPHVAASLSQQAAAPFQIQGQIRDPVANITPGDLQQVADVAAAKSRARKPKPKPRSATTPTITIIDDYNENQTGDGPGGVVRRNSNASSVNTAVKDPTRGIKDSSSRVTKRASSPSAQKSSLTNNSFVSAKQSVPDMDASDAPVFAEQQLQLQQGQYQQSYQVIEMSQSPNAQKGDLRSPNMPLPCASELIT